MWVLQHTETGKYVARPGSERSYTNDLNCARRFRTAEDAERERCTGSERLINLWDTVFNYG